MATYFQRDVNWSALKQTSNLSPEIKEHLTNVYSLLAATILASAAGGIFYLKTMIGGGLTFLAGFLMILWLSITPKQEIQKRVGILLGFGFIQGLSIGPLLLHVLDIDPQIVTSAFLGTVCIFGCFSATAYYAERRSYLFLGGFLSSALTTMVILGFLNIFFSSLFMFNILLYGGLIVFSGFVIFDTQLIIEKAAMGNKDFVTDSLELFLDFINIFVRLLILLSKDKKKERR